jgi:uncharacterized protein (DUF1697 family)
MRGPAILHPSTMHVKYVAFFRNVNLGHTRSPSRAQLENAFLQSGAESAVSFQTNGTLVYTAASREHAESVLVGAREALHRSCGTSEPAFLRALSDLTALQGLDPFRDREPEGSIEYAITFLAAPVQISAPLRSSRGDIEVFRFTASEAFSTAQRMKAGIGSPNALLEKVLGMPATTRKWSTILRLLAKHA